jgi:hypothetical protein
MMLVSGNFSQNKIYPFLEQDLWFRVIFGKPRDSQSENTGAARWSMKWVGFVANADICIGYELEMNNDR